MVRSVQCPCRNVAFRYSRRRCLAIGAIIFGLFTFIAAYGGILIALPSVADHFGSDLPTTQWVMIGYVLAISVALLPMGRLADMVGRKAVYVGGFAVLTLTGVVARLAPTVPTLILANTLHGFGAGSTQGTTMAMVVALFPASERGKVLGIYVGVIGAGTAFGPAAGGLIAGTLGWQWIFFVSALMGLVAMGSAMVLVDARGTGPDGAKVVGFDWVGAVLSGAALLAFLQAMTWAPTIGYGHLQIVLAFATAALAFAFVAWELRT